MFKYVFDIIKKIILGILLLYTYNMLVYSLNVTIPINLFTIIFVTIFGFSGMIGLCMFSLFIL